MSALYSPWTVYRDNVSFMSLYRVTRVKRYVKNVSLVPRPFIVLVKPNVKRNEWKPLARSHRDKERSDTKTCSRWCVKSRLDESFQPLLFPPLLLNCFSRGLFIELLIDDLITRYRRKIKTWSLFRRTRDKTRLIITSFLSRLISRTAKKETRGSFSW